MNWAPGAYICPLNLCQKMSEKMQKDSGQSDHSILRKRPKCGENWPFWDIWDLFRLGSVNM